MALQLPWPWPFAAAAPAPVQQHHGEVVAFGEEPTFSLSTVAGSGPGHAVVHVYGTQHELNNPLSSIMVGTVIPDAHRLDYATELFDLADVDAQGFLDTKKLQLAMRVVSLRLKPKDVFRAYGSIEGALLIEEFVLFLSTEAKKQELVSLVPLDLLREIRSMYHLVMKSNRNSKLDKHELETLVTYLGLDLSQEEVDHFVESRHGHDVLSFMNQFVHKIDKGVSSGERSLSVRNWFPGAWYVRDKQELTKRVVRLYFQNASGRFTKVGKILSCAPVPGQPLLVALRLDQGQKFNVLVPKMETAHALAFRDAALTLFDQPEVPLGVVSTETVCELINKVCGAVHLKEMTKQDMVHRVFDLLLDAGAETVEQDELLVALKLLGQHAEPQHVNYLLSRAPRKSLGDLSLDQIITAIMGTDVRLALPLQTVEKLKEMFAEFDSDGDGALTVPELHKMTSLLGLGWTPKDIMVALGLSTKEAHKVNEVVLVDFLHFIDAMVEGYGDPFYDLRYRQLFRLVDVQNSNSLEDEELLPVLMAAGLDEATAKATCNRLLGGQLTMSAYQFAAGMFEEEITREAFPGELLKFAMAFSNVDFDDTYKINSDKLLIFFRKMGAVFTQKDLDSLLKQLDPSGDGTCSFKEFVVGLRNLDTSKLGGLADVCNVNTMAFIGSYELTSTVDELDQLRDTASRAWLERTAANLMATYGQVSAEKVDDAELLNKRRAEGVLDSIQDNSNTAFSTMLVLRILLCCYFSVFRALSYGAGSAGLGVVFQNLSNKFPTSEDNPTGDMLNGYIFWVHNIIQYIPTIFVSTVEAMTIYYDLLRTSVALTQIASLKLWPQDPVRMFVANSIVSEALELGHPTYIRFGINPLAGASKFIIQVCGMLYKARGGLTKFLIKILLRRVVSRSALKGVFPLIGLPIVAFWDALLAFNVLTAVRTVALGRCCVVGITDAILAIHEELERQVDAGVELSMAVDLARIRSHALGSRHDTFDPESMSHDLKVALLRAIAMSVVQARSFHPNLELLIKHVMYRLRIDPLTIEGLDDEKLFKKCLPELTLLERYTVLSMLNFALVLDGTVTISQRLHMKQIQLLCGLSPNVGAFMRVSRKFNNLSLQPEDVAFAIFGTREKDDETSGDITPLEQVEAAIGSVLRLLTF